MFSDDHLHLLGTAAAAAAVDLTAARAPTVDAVLALIARAAADRRPGSWIRCWGFDAALVRERRAPTRPELDRVAPHHAVVLHHRSGHERQHNSMAAGLGEPPRRDYRAQLDRFADRLRRRSIVAVTDATATNSLDDVEYVTQCRLPLDVTMMIGADQVADARHRGYRFGDSFDGTRLGHAKILADVADIGPKVAACHSNRWPVAVHVDDVDVLDATLAAFELFPPPDGTFHRIEHLSLALPEQLDRLSSLAVPPVVVTQPGFLVERAAKYRQELTTVEQDWLYPVATLASRGVTVRFSSDSPVGAAVPERWIDAAVRRNRFAAHEAVSTAEASAMCELDAVADRAR